MVCRDMRCLGSPGIAGPRAFPKQDYSAAAASRKQACTRLNVIVEPETGVGIEESERLSFARIGGLSVESRTCSIPNPPGRCLLRAAAAVAPGFSLGCRLMVVLGRESWSCRRAH